jgi:hypothetical protein
MTFPKTKPNFHVQKRLPSLAFCLAIWLTMLFTTVSTVMADLDASQRKMLADAARFLDSAEANLKLARDGLGTKQSSASAKKLAMSRCQLAKQSVAEANALLANLPTRDPNVEKLASRAKALDDSILEMGRSLSPPSSTTPGQTPTQAIGSTVVRLDFRQRESLKNAQFHVSDLDGKAQALAELASQVKSAQDPISLDYRLLSRGMNTIADSKQKIQNATSHLSGLADQGEGVGQVRQQLKEAIEKIEAFEKIIAPAHQKLMSLLDPKNNAGFAADFQRLQQLGQMYANTQLLQSHHALAAELALQIPDAQKECDRILAQYSVQIDQQTPDGQRLAGASRHLQEKTAQFRTAAAAQKAVLPDQIDADLAQALALSESAVQEKKPAFFAEGGGILQRLAWAESKLILLQALDEASAKTRGSKIEETRRLLKDRQTSLRDQIIQTNRLTSDNYSGTDREELERLAIEAWRKEEPDAQVLMVAIPNQSWERETMWRWQNEWYYVDRSKIQVQLCIKESGTLATIRPIDLWKDHTNADVIKAFPMDSRTDQLPPQRFLRIDELSSRLGNSPKNECPK